MRGRMAGAGGHGQVRGRGRGGRPQRAGERAEGWRSAVPWGYLIIAIILEVCGTTSMKLSQGFTRLGPSLAIFVFYALSFGLLTLALKAIDVSVAYAIWSGVGTALIAAIGMVWFKEPVTAVRMISIVLIVAGVVGLNLSGAAR